MRQILIHKVAHSMINLMKQTQGTDFPSVPIITKFILTQPFRTVNNTIQQTQMRLRRWYYDLCSYSQTAFVSSSNEIAEYGFGSNRLLVFEEAHEAQSEQVYGISLIS